MIHLYSSINVAATCMRVSFLIQWCQVSLPASLAVNRDFSQSHGAIWSSLNSSSSSRYDDFLLVQVRDTTGQATREKVLAVK